jgi:hypothetical protein
MAEDKEQKQISQNNNIDQIKKKKILQYAVLW